MLDELDPLLLRAFAQSERNLSDAQFVARIAAQLNPRRGLGQTLLGIMAGGFRGLATGITAPLRLRYAPLLALTAAAVTLGSALLSSL